MRLICLASAWLSLLGSTTQAADDAPTASPTRKPNIMIILADDLGYGDLGCYGQKILQTPRLDQMAAEGLKFSQFYAGCTVCAPSRCVLMTGKHNGRAVVRGNSMQPIILTPGTPTIASVLKSAGYKTGCVGKWGVGSPDNLTNPNDVGFDYFFGYVNMVHAHNPWPEFLVRNGKVVPLENVVDEKWAKWRDIKLPDAGRGVAVKHEQYAPDLIVEQALDYIRHNKEQTFFLLVSLITPHANNEGGKAGMEVPDLGEFKDKDWPEPEKAFAAVMQNLDRDTGKILDLLKELKIDEQTLVMFTSDNGPHSEGGHDAEFFDSNGKLRGIKRDLLEGGIRVPTIARWPGTVKAGSENDRVWYHGDLLATAAELAGADFPADLDSESLAPELKGAVVTDRWKRKARMYWEFHERETGQAVRFGKWKAIRSPMFTGEIILYDMSNDASEKSNYAIRRPDLRNHAENLLNKSHEPDPNWKVPIKKDLPQENK